LRLLWLEDLMDMLEVVVWNEVYLKVSDILVPGRVVEIESNTDRRDEMFRATVVEIKTLQQEGPNGERSEDTSTGIRDSSPIFFGDHGR